MGPWAGEILEVENRKRLNEQMKKQKINTKEEIGEKKIKSVNATFCCATKGRLIVI